MYKDYMKMKRAEIQIDVASDEGVYEGFRHSLGYGGINRQPLPEKIIRGMKALKPCLVRIFLQEYFHVYPKSGVFDFPML